MHYFTHFQDLTDSCPKSDRFLDFANSRFPSKKNTPFFVKMGTSVVYVLVESGRAGNLTRFFIVG